jgi:YesN/AraC family two-component response regulator
MLVADDEEDMRVLVRSVISRANQGLVVESEASNGIEAVERWREFKPDVVILDQRMPGLTGLEAAEKILDEQPEQTIVLFSAFLNDVVRAAAAAIGIRVCVSKENLFSLPETLWSFG